MNSALYVNEAAKLVQALNAAGYKHHGAEHRLGSLEMDIIANAMAKTVKRHEECLKLKAKELFGQNIDDIIEA